MTIARQKQPLALPAGDGAHLNVLGMLVTFKAFTRDTNGAYCLFEAHISPGAVLPLHYHPADDEGFYFLDDGFVFTLGERQIAAGRGTYIFVPRNTIHGYQNTGDRVGRVLVTVSPGNIHEQHFLNHSRRIADPAAPLEETRPEEIERYLAEAPKYGTILVPAPATR